MEPAPPRQEFSNRQLLWLSKPLPPQAAYRAMHSSLELLIESILLVGEFNDSITEVPPQSSHGELLGSWGGGLKIAST